MSIAIAVFGSQDEIWINQFGPEFSLGEILDFCQVDMGMTKIELDSDDYDLELNLEQNKIQYGTVLRTKTQFILDDLDSFCQRILTKSNLQNNYGAFIFKLVNSSNSDQGSTGLDKNILTDHMSRVNLERDQVKALYKVNPKTDEIKQKIIAIQRRKAVMRNLVESLAERRNAQPVRNLIFEGSFNSSPFSLLIDTGAEMSCISSAAVDRLKLSHLVDTSIQANAVGVGQLKTEGLIHNFKFNLVDLSMSHNNDVTMFSIPAHVLPSAPTDLVLGLDFLAKYKIGIDFNSKKLTFPTLNLSFTF